MSQVIRIILINEALSIFPLFPLALVYEVSATCPPPYTTTFSRTLGQSKVQHSDA